MKGTHILSVHTEGHIKRPEGGERDEDVPTIVCRPGNNSENSKNSGERATYHLVSTEKKTSQANKTIGARGTYILESRREDTSVFGKKVMGHLRSEKRGERDCEDAGRMKVRKGHSQT